MTGANGGQGVCQVSINIQVNIIIAPVTIAPAAITAVFGPLVTAVVPLPFIGIFPIVWTATPLPGCPGKTLPSVHSLLSIFVDETALVAYQLLLQRQDAAAFMSTKRQPFL